LLQTLAEDLPRARKLIERSFIDASSRGAKKGAWCRPYKTGKGSKIMESQTAMVFLSSVRWPGFAS